MQGSTARCCNIARPAAILGKLTSCQSSHAAHAYEGLHLIASLTRPAARPGVIFQGVFAVQAF